MKSTISTRLLVSAAALIAAAVPALSCGPFYPIIPTPDFFEISIPHRTMADFDREENLRLWQEMTSADIPLSDIETAVYTRTADCNYGNPDYRKLLHENKFYTYLNNTRDEEILDYLAKAKEIESRRELMKSAWYYPESRNYYEDAPAAMDDIIAECMMYDGSRLKDRYAMLAVRSMFAAGQYSRCIEYCDTAFTDIPDGNLFKSMAERYAAGAWCRLSDVERADSIFAKAGDVWSVSEPNRLDYMLRFNPSAPQLMEWLRCNADDYIVMITAAAEAGELLRDNRVTNKGDWHFLRSYVNNLYYSNVRLARNDIREALKHDFSSDEMRDLARVWRMKLDAMSGDTSSLLADLKWIEEKTEPLNSDAKEWARRIRNIIYADYVPEMWRRGDYTTAILLCGYADNLDRDKIRYDVTLEYFYTDNRCFFPPIVSKTLQELRKSTVETNPSDYSMLSFQLMGSLSSGQLAAVYNNMQQATPLYEFLKRRARTDRDYYYETIGTLALREENFTRAEHYLSRVSDEYIRTMNTQKGGYFDRDIFDCYSSYRFGTGNPHSDNPKLTFARMMKSLKHTMLYGSTADQRGLAKIRYATARRASYNGNWALTQYWRGYCPGTFMAILNYGDNEDDVCDYSFLYDYDTSDEEEAIEVAYEKAIDEALATLTTDEARAEAQYILGNLATVIACYPSTTTAAHIRTSCDTWSTWI
ncbi:MAG: hypothetical protein HDS61_01245 [Barnesiella sp.]|nr:hypothetical protein [Barnesiella sp.]